MIPQLLATLINFKAVKKTVDGAIPRGFKEQKLLK
jgi:hypothetical protein